MPNISRIDPPELFQGAPYHYGTLVESGSVLFTAGACPIDQDGHVIGGDSYEVQANVALDNLEAVLAEAGAGPEHLVRTTIYVVGEPAQLVEVWDVIAARLEPHRPPSTLLGVAALGYPGQLVEIDGIAAITPIAAIEE